MESQAHRFTWQGIEIEIVYEPVSYGGMAHLKVQSITPEDAPLPITTTGYRSHFHPAGTIEAQGGDVVEAVTAWLDGEAAKPHWKRYVEASRQFCLF